jgi:MSHA pilin protein MshA
MNKAQKGFTLIELVVVITILGILAAFAFPRFAGLEKEARISATEALHGSIRAASSLAHGLTLAQGNGPAVGISMEGQAVTMVQHYPDADGISLALQDTTGFTFVVVGAVATAETNGGTATTCTVTYTEAAAGSSPAITIVTTGC